MFNTTHQTLKILAALTWYSGVVVLTIKSMTLFISAYTILPEVLRLSMLIIIGIVIGLIKANYLFNKLCFKNLQRIASLQNPKIWQFYRGRFFIFLASMILLGNYLSKIVDGSYLFMATVAVIELSIATALLVSSRCFFSHAKKRGQVFTFASSLTLFDKVKDTHFIMHSVS